MIHSQKSYHPRQDTFDRCPIKEHVNFSPDRSTAQVQELIAQVQDPIHIIINKINRLAQVFRLVSLCLEPFSFAHTRKAVIGPQARPSHVHV